MTNEEAIKHLKEWREVISSGHRKAVIDMAISALSADNTLLEIVTCAVCKYWDSATHGCKRNPSVDAWYETDWCSYGELTTNYTIKALRAEASQNLAKPNKTLKGSDLISRRALCEYALNQKDKSVTPNDIMRFPSALPSAEAVQGWTPCSVKLPKRGIDVLVTRDYNGRKEYQRSRKYVEMAACFGEDEDTCWVSLFDEYKTTPEHHRVIAWMPLPEPYKGGV